MRFSQLRPLTIQYISSSALNVSDNSQAGLDPYGETYLVVKKNQQELAMKLMNDPLENCQSSLLVDQSGLMRLCLDLICCKLASTVCASTFSAFLLFYMRLCNSQIITYLVKYLQDEQLELCLSRSFLAVHSTKELMKERLRMALEYLQAENFVETRMGEERRSELLPRCLGLSTFKTSFTIGVANLHSSGDWFRKLIHLVYSMQETISFKQLSNLICTASFK